jgi:nucleoside-diphosphate-sugar epimerase
MAYQFTSPFVVDSRLTERRLGLEPTPVTEGVRATLAWWRAGSTAQ